MVMVRTATPDDALAVAELSAQLGYPAQDYLSQPHFWRDHLHPEDAAGAYAHMERAAAQDAIVMSAAVADYTPARPARDKVKKADGPVTITLNRTTDILADLGRLLLDEPEEPAAPRVLDGVVEAVLDERLEDPRVVRHGGLDRQEVISQAGGGRVVVGEHRQGERGEDGGLETIGSGHGALPLSWPPPG